MKKFIALTLVLVLALGMLAGCGKKDDKPESTDGTAAVQVKTIEEGKLIMSTNAAFPPYEFKDDAGKFVGIDVEVADAIAKKLGLELQVDDMGFTAALEAAQSGASDMVMAGVTVTDARKTVMDFSDSYATGIQVVIVKEDSDIKSVDDLTGKQIGCQMGTTGYIFASDVPENGGYGEDMVTPYDNGITAVQALKGGQIDCVIIDKGPAEAFIKDNPGLKILETEWLVENYSIGFAKGNTQLVEAVNQALEELTAEGVLQNIVDKYISAN